MLLGRDDELGVLLDLITDARVVTVSGPGGSGKTRLALEVARRAAPRFDAVWFVALEPLPDPNDAMGAVARAMALPEVPGVDAAERVLDHLRARSALLVLDHLEHLIDVAPLIGQVARAGAEVRVLVTSQLPLRVGGEHVLALEPLAVPTGSEREPETLGTVASVAVLMAHADGVAITPDVARLCRLLEGMPLALELAGARLGTHEAREVSHGLEDVLSGWAGDDEPPRQRGLWGVLEWSVGLLSQAERALLLDLSVFAGGFTTELAQAAFGDVEGALPALAQAGLVRPGLQTSGQGGRWAMLAPVRGFATQLLAVEPEAPDAAHAAVTDALIALAQPYERRWVACAGEGRLALSPEEGNIMAELDWAQLMDYGRHARLAAATAWWMAQSGAAEFSRDHLEIALARSTDPTMRARCLQALGAVGGHDSDPTAGLDAADAWHDLGDAEGEFYSVIQAADLYARAGEGEAAIEVTERCDELVGSLPGDADARWVLEAVRAQAIGLLGEPAAALEPLPALLAEAAPGSWRQYAIATRAADLELVLHRPERALAHGGTAMAVLARLGTPVEELSQAATIAAALMQLRRVSDAATTWSVCELCEDELSWSMLGAAREWLEAVRASLAEADVAAGRRRAAQRGMEAGLAWVGRLARGED